LGAFFATEEGVLLLAAIAAYTTISALYFFWDYYIQLIEIVIRVQEKWNRFTLKFLIPPTLVLFVASLVYLCGNPIHLKTPCNIVENDGLDYLVYQLFQARGNWTQVLKVVKYYPHAIVKSYERGTLLGPILNCIFK
jgi:hypothetical protein